MGRASMKCPLCRKKINRKDKFCVFCGCNLKREKRKKICKVFMIILLFFFGCIIIIYNETEKQLQNNRVEITKEYSNGDKVYNPSEDAIVYDEENYVIFYNNLLIVYLEKDMSTSDKENLAESVKGSLVGNISGCMNIIEILVENTDYLTLNKKAEQLMQMNNVIYASVECPKHVGNDSVLIDDNNPWETSTETHDKKNHDGAEDKPEGHDWWAESIGMYTAWNYVDYHKDELADVKIGIIDLGVDDQHEEFLEDGKSKINHLEDYRYNDPSDHGTHVSGLIGAQNNSTGIRGVADQAKLYCVDFSAPVSEVEADTNERKDIYSTGQYIEVTKQLLDEGVCVINNSWTTTSEYKMDRQEFLESIESAYYDDLENDKGFRRFWEYAMNSKEHNMEKLKQYDEKEKLYEEYQKLVELTAKRESFQLMYMMVELFLNGKEDFIIVEAAGNGYHNTNLGYQAELSGKYCAITEKNYNDLDKNKALTNLGFSYEKFKKHIIIVGAAKLVNGNYELTRFSNYGNSVDLVAPGNDIFSTVTIRDDPDGVKNTLDGRLYSDMSGTSMAAPIVSGAVALLWSVKPELSVEEVKNILINTANTAQSCNNNDRRRTYPMLNVKAALSQLTTQGLKEAYYRIIEQKEQEFGLYEIHEMSNVQYASGVCYLELRDINKDGVKELFLVYNTNQKDEYGNLHIPECYQYEVWTYTNGETILLESDGLYYSNGGWPSVCWTEYNGKTYIVTNSSEGANSYCFHGYMEDGNFGIVNSFVCKYADGSELSINGKNVDLEEWNKNLNNYITNITCVALFYQAGDQVYENVKSVKDFLTITCY